MFYSKTNLILLFKRYPLADTSKSDAPKQGQTQGWQSLHKKRSLPVVIHLQLRIGSDPNTNSFGALSFAQREGTRWGGRTGWVLVGGEGPGEDGAKGGAARPVGAARPRERGQEGAGRQTERESCTGGKQKIRGEGARGTPQSATRSGRVEAVLVRPKKVPFE